MPSDLSTFPDAVNDLARYVSNPLILSRPTSMVYAVYLLKISNWWQTPPT